MRRRKCPECGAECGPGAGFCTKCGASLRTGMVGRPAPRAGRPAVWPSRLLSPLLWFLELFPGMARPGVLIASVVVFVVALAVGWLAIFLFLLGGVIFAFFIGAFAVVLYWTALSWLLYGGIVMPAEALSDFDGKQWIVFILMTLIPMSIMFGLAKAPVGP